MPPPAYRTKEASLAYRWVADPYDKRMRVCHPTAGHLLHTPLGMCVEMLSWIEENPQDFDPVRNSLIEVLSVFHPESLKELNICPL